MARCKVGDLCVVINPHPDYAYLRGRLTTILSQDLCLLPDIGWETDVVMWNGEHGYCRDECLQPIRDQPGTDETLLWAPVPSIPVEAHQ